MNIQLKNIYIVSAIAFLLFFTFSSASAQTGKLYHGEFPGSNKYNSDFDGSSIETISNLGAGSLDIEVDKDEGFVYWASFTSNQLNRSRLDGSDAIVLHTTTGSPFGLDIDPVGGRIFAAHWNGDNIRCGNLDGSGALTTIVNTPQNATDVEYDEVSGFLYYGVINSGIWRVQMGAGCSIVGSETLLIADIGRPYGIALDNALNSLWWTNSTQDRISFANLNGGAVNLNFCNTGNFLTGLAYLDGTLYFSDFGADNSFSTPVNSCSPTALGTN